MPSKKRSLLAASGAGGDSLYVEDVFSTYLYTGADANETVTNGIDLDGEGGFVWIKPRTTTGSHLLYDTERGIGTYLQSQTTAAASSAVPLGSFNSDGFTTFAYAPAAYVSWSFRKAEKFFDVVTYTGNSTVGRTVAHNLGVAPAWMVIKSTNAARNWCTYHISLGNGYQIILNGTAAKESTALWNSTTPTATEFTLGNDGDVNGTGNSYVAYLFASDAGGFGDDEDENIIKCGSYVGNATNRSVTLGWEPQYVLIKNTTNADNWIVFDMMRGVATGGVDAYLIPNSTSTEEDGTDYITFGATGFTVHTGYGLINESGSTYIYIAIRRPMKTPTAGTEVFSASTYAGNDPTPTVITTGFPVDLALTAYRDLASAGAFGFTPRLTQTYLYSATTAAEVATGLAFDSNTSFATDDNAWNQSPSNLIGYGFKRATGFMDVVCYTGDGTTPRNITHNLGVVPEFIVTKRRDAVGAWPVYNPDLGITSTSAIRLNTNDGSGYSQLTRYPSTPTSTVFTVGNDSDLNASANTYVSYLFATVAGVSKVGSYTGTAATLNVDCGFTAGARFILIKRYGSAGDWYVYDSVRGISAGNDPYLLLNSTAAEVTGTDYIDPLNAGFTVTSSAPAGLNASSGSYIFLAIA